MSEEIGNLFKSKVSSLSDDASIVEAFSVYHYGKDNYSTSENAAPNSIEGHFISVNDRVGSLESTVDQLGNVYVLKISPSTNPNVITTDNPNSTPITIRAQDNQVADLQKWVDDDGNTILGRVDSTGKMFSNNVEVVTLSQTQTLTNKNIDGGTVNATVLQQNSIPAVTTTGTQTLTNKTLTSPLINDGLFTGPKEKTTIVAAASTGTINYDCLTQTVLFYSSNATANWTLNFRGSSSVSMNDLLNTGDSITLVFLAQQGGTAYRPTSFQIDGAGITPLWSGGSAPVAGNINSIDGYTFTIIKLGNANYTLLGGQVQFK